MMTQPIRKKNSEILILTRFLILRKFSNLNYRGPVRVNSDDKLHKRNFDSGREESEFDSVILAF